MLTENESDINQYTFALLQPTCHSHPQQKIGRKWTIRLGVARNRESRSRKRMTSIESKYHYAILVQIHQLRCFRSTEIKTKMLTDNDRDKNQYTIALRQHNCHSHQRTNGH
jgi:hypothetical protein